MVALDEITALLDRELDIAAFEDASHNGLQVGNSGAIRRVCVGVDASMDFFTQAARQRADLLICHHGLSWGDSLRRITGINYRRLKFLLDHDMALYACHLPLDAHPVLGNNAGIAKAFELRNIQPFGDYHGMTIGCRGALPRSLPYERFKKRARAVFGSPLQTMDFGKPTVRSVAIVSGGAADQVAEAGDAGIDVYISGEPKLSAWHLAQEYAIHAVFAGHYATETFGVKAVASLLTQRLGLKTRFLDMNVPF